VQVANDGMAAFRVDEAANESYRFFWNDFCDWYLEITKPVFRKETSEEELAETRVVLAHVLETSLRLIHPLMPYITEELWQRLPRPRSRKTSVAFGPYPLPSDGIEDEAALREMEIFKAVVSAARTIRSEHEIEPKADVPLSLRADGDGARALLDARLGTISVLVRSKSPTVEAAGTTTSIVPSAVGPIEVHVGLKGLVTKAKELLRIEREMKRIDKDLGAIEKKMSSKGFLDRAPKEVIDETNALKQQLVDARVRLDESRKLADELDEPASTDDKKKPD
jgi:valyl-tRNA synthetase